MNGYWNNLIEAQGDGSALSNSTTATSILPAGAKKTLPANFFRQVGQKLRIRAHGRISTVVTTPGTLTFAFRLGPTANIVVAQSQAFTLSTSAKTNVGWFLDWMLTLRAIGGGTAANFMHQGVWTSEACGATTVAGEAKSGAIQSSAPAVGTGFDETVASLADLYATWSVANSSNSIQLHGYELDSCGD
jgi:hypothetical protein